MSKYLPSCLSYETITVCISFVAHGASYCVFNLLFYFSSVLMGPGFWEKKNWVVPLTILPAVNKLELDVWFRCQYIYVSIPPGLCLVSRWITPLPFSEASGELLCQQANDWKCPLSASSKAEGSYCLQGPSTQEQSWFFFHCLLQA